MRLEKTNINEVLDLFEKATNENLKILILFKAKAQLECVPLGVVEQKGAIYFKVVDSDKNEKLVSVNRVSAIQTLGKNYNFDNKPNETVIYKLKGGLASRYALREHEEEYSNNLPDDITIANHGEERQELLARLLRYGDLCEIIKPQSYREEMKFMLEEMLENYGE